MHSEGKLIHGMVDDVWSNSMGSCSYLQWAAVSALFVHFPTQILNTTKLYNYTTDTSYDLSSSGSGA